jgi:alpha-L-arabinofuranosidase
VDEALEEIEYVSGPADSTWGKRRAADGFTEPFTLHYVEVGNEDGFDRSGSYDGRFTQFFDAIRAKYPNLKIIATAPVKSRTPDLYDDHYYSSARQMAFDWRHYDAPTETQPRTGGGGRHSGSFERSGPQIFVGEWATQEGRPTPDLNAALADAAWLMGLERNADIVPIECYAPLLVNVNPEDTTKGYPQGWQWPTNLIGYDAQSSFGSPSYYAQAMFGQNKGDVVLPVNLTVPPTMAATEPVPHGMVGVGTWHTQVEYKDIAVTAPDGQTLLTADLSKDTGGWHFTGPKWNLQDQSIKPSAADSTSWATTGDPKWTDYTIRLKARKLGGAEGFLVLYHAIDGENFSWWNIGGWGNSKTQLEATHDDARAPFGPESPFKVETGRWYDLRVEVHGHTARCFIDDKLVTEGTERPQPVSTPVFASASFASADHAVIVKVVNLGNDPIEATLNLRGAQSIAPEGTVTVLSGEPRDVNTIDQPTKIAPKTEPLRDLSPSFSRTFPPHSLTLLRLTVTPAEIR